MSYFALEFGQGDGFLPENRELLETSDVNDLMDIIDPENDRTSASDYIALGGLFDDIGIDHWRCNKAGCTVFRLSYEEYTRESQEQS